MLLIFNDSHFSYRQTNLWCQTRGNFTNSSNFTKPQTSGNENLSLGFFIFDLHFLCFRCTFTPDIFFPITQIAKQSRLFCVGRRTRSTITLDNLCDYICYWVIPVFKAPRDSSNLNASYHKRSLYHVIIWLAPWQNKISLILRCDWLPELSRYRYFALSGFPAVSRKKIVSFSYNKSFIDPACSVKMVEYWLVLFCEFTNLLSLYFLGKCDSVLRTRFYFKTRFFLELLDIRFTIFPIHLL